jgi:hypothetical protein
MPFLDDRQARELLANAWRWRPVCCAGGTTAKDYCRSCDEFYWLHSPGCPHYESKHHGHRLTIVPFVEVR